MGMGLTMKSGSVTMASCSSKVHHVQANWQESYRCFEHHFFVDGGLGMALSLGLGSNCVHTDSWDPG